MKDIRTGFCPLCEHDEIIEATPPDFGDEAEHMAAVTYAPRKLMRGRDPRRPFGMLLLYVCRHCGYCQSFANKPKEIPIGEDYETRLIKGRGPGATYR
jgi:hypothetical protein